MSSLTENYYRILGVKPTATSDEIKSAYRKLSRKYHPDTNPDDSAKEMFQKISKAYDVLKNHSSRREYDDSLSKATVTNLKQQASSVVENFWSKLKR